MRFIFVRHGKTHFNEINLTQGWCDSPLSKVGIKQVENISKQLEQYQIDKAYTSPLGRAVQTANIILSKKEVEPIYEERFKEVNFGILEGISTELVRKLNIESPDWLEDLDMDYRPYEGEDIHDVILKHRKALQEIIEDCNEKDTVLIVGHGCSLYGFIKSLLPQQSFKFPNNASAMIVDYVDETFSLKKVLDPMI
jgi:alpha-ribazole phosphatase